MDRVLVVVFDNETKASQGKTALRELESEGSISLYASAVILKHADGSVTVKDEAPVPPLGSLFGTPTGALIGLLGGPTGAILGASAGLLFGGLADLDNARVGQEFVNDVSDALTPNKVALVAEVDEEWTTPVDARMESLGGTLFRQSLWEVERHVDDEDTAAMKADLVALKAELAKESAERRMKLQARIDTLQAKIQARWQELRERREAQKRLASAKREVLKKNAEAAGRAIKDLANTAV